MCVCMCVSVWYIKWLLIKSDNQTKLHINISYLQAEYFSNVGDEIVANIELDQALDSLQPEKGGKSVVFHGNVHEILHVVQHGGVHEADVVVRDVQSLQLVQLGNAVKLQDAVVFKRKLKQIATVFQTLKKKKKIQHKWWHTQKKNNKNKYNLFKNILNTHLSIFESSTGKFHLYFNTESNLINIVYILPFTF